MRPEWKEKIASQVMTWGARNITSFGPHLWFISPLRHVPKDWSGGYCYSWVGAQWPPGKVKYFPSCCLAAATLKPSGSASFEQSESAWSHCVGQAQEPGLAFLSFLAGGQVSWSESAALCTRWSGWSFPIPVSTLVPCSASTLVAAFSRPSCILAGLLPPAWAEVFWI